jgi:hypothetical protein
MKSLRFSCLILASALFCSSPLFSQTHAVRHSRYPNSPSNDPQLQIPGDQAQSCFAPESSLSGFEQYQTYDDYPHPAKSGYLCIAVPQGKTFVIDNLFAEADYDSVLPAPAEWYLDSSVGGYENMTGFAAVHAGSETANPHYVLSQPVHLAVAGGTRVTLVMHNFYVNTSSSVGETPGTATLAISGHWE